MEATARWVLLTSIPPIAWGTNYYVTHAYLPADRPLWGAAVRAVPAGLILAAIARRRPHGRWWWRSAVLGFLNTATFFVLIYVASTLLPTSVASTVMAASPLAMLLVARMLAGQRAAPTHLVGAIAGLGGVALMLLGGTGAAVSLSGVGASAAAMVTSSVGYVLSARWRDGADPLAVTSWQLTAGGLMLLPVAVLAEGAPPAPSMTVTLAFGYTSLVATALAFTLWFGGLRQLSAGTVGLLGLLNPLSGVLLGTLVADESLGQRQWCGLALVIGGILLGRPRTRPRPARAEHDEDVETSPDRVLRPRTLPHARPRTPIATRTLGRNRPDADHAE